MFLVATVRDPKDPAPDPTPAVPSLVHELKAALQRMVATRALRDPLHALHPDLTGAQTHVLVALALAGEGGMPSSSLAQRICASAPTMTGMLDRLEHQGLVSRVRGEEDRRQVRVCLTDAGRGVIAVLDAHITDRLQSMLSCLDESERPTFVRLFCRVLDALPLASDAADLHADKEKG